MKRAIILFSITLLSSCTPSLYYVTTDSTYEELEDEKYKKKLIYLGQDIANLNRLDSLADVINDRKWRQFDEKIKFLSAEDQQFLISIKHLLRDDFFTSYELLDSLPDDAYNCQVMLLKTDCLYEIGSDSVNYTSNYQNAMNCSQNQIIKSIIKTRYRFLRYGK